MIYVFTLKPLESSETKVVNLLLKRRKFSRVLTIWINQDYRMQKLSTFSEHLSSGEKVTATICIVTKKNDSDIRLQQNRQQVGWKMSDKATSEPPFGRLHLPIPSSAETWKIFTNKLYQFFFSLKLTF